MSQTLNSPDVPVFSYIISSADMRHIEIEKTNIYLRNDQDGVLIFQGKVSGSRPGFFIDLSEILLQYVMSCEGCKDHEVALQEVVHFGEHLGEILIKKSQHDLVDLPSTDKLWRVFKSVLSSMDVSYTVDSNENLLEYALDCCPIRGCASKTGLGRSVELAHVAFVALCSTLVTALAPEWVLLQPSDMDLSHPIEKIVVARKDEN